MTRKFQVGDRIKSKTTGNVYTVAEIGGGSLGWWVKLTDPEYNGASYYEERFSLVSPVSTCLATDAGAAEYEEIIAIQDMHIP